MGTILLQPRWAMSFLRGPMTRNEIRRARALFSNVEAKVEASADASTEANAEAHAAWTSAIA
jgi:hypothetical protein